MFKGIWNLVLIIVLVGILGVACGDPKSELQEVGKSPTIRSPESTSSESLVPSPTFLEEESEFELKSNLSIGSSYPLENFTKFRATVHIDDLGMSYNVVGDISRYRLPEGCSLSDTPGPGSNGFKGDVYKFIQLVIVCGDPFLEGFEWGFVRSRGDLEEDLQKAIFKMEELEWEVWKECSEGYIQCIKPSRVRERAAGNKEQKLKIEDLKEDLRNFESNFKSNKLDNQLLIKAWMEDHFWVRFKEISVGKNLSRRGPRLDYSLTKFNSMDQDEYFEFYIELSRLDGWIGILELEETFWTLDKCQFLNSGPSYEDPQSLTVGIGCETAVFGGQDPTKKVLRNWAETSFQIGLVKEEGV